MNPILDKALLQALSGSQDALAEFGLERHTLAGPGIPGAGSEWDERLTLTGDGILTLSSNRSIADISSEPIGLYRKQDKAETVRRAIQLVRESALAELPPLRVEPADARIRINVACGGVVERVTLGLTDPMALEPARPLLQELDRMAQAVRADPIRTLRIELDMPDNVPAAKVRLRLMVIFQNSGTEGYWLTHPGALRREHRWEQCTLVYGRKPEIVPGFTPPPIELQAAALEPIREEGLDLLWIPRGEEVEQRFNCVMEPPVPGLYLARAVFSSYLGEDQVSGRPRLRGCAFSNQVELEVT
ncbi:MAG: hypothetical protein QM757_29070 [Paludibaculum sp.]